MEKKKNNNTKKTTINVDKIKNAVIIVLSLVIVFGLAYVVPELKNCGTCKEEQKELTNISMSDYRELLKGDEVSFIYLASPNCTHCRNQEPIMKRLVNEYDVTVNYLNVAAITDNEADEVYKTYANMQVERYQMESLRTPTMLLVQKGKVIDMHLGELSLDSLVKFLKEHIEVGE